MKIRERKKILLVFIFAVIIFSFIVFILNNPNYNEFFSVNKIRAKSNLPRIVIVIGTRPEAIKCAPLISELRNQIYKKKFEVLVLSTGQHREILRQTLGSFSQTVDIDLDLMTKNQDISLFFNSAFLKITNEFKRLTDISLVVVQGDTTTALAAALAASYLHIPVAHVEAGLRSYDMENPYPEEMNRKVIDAVSHLMMAPTEYSKQALIKEGVCPSDIFVTGNTGIDAFYSLQKMIPNTMPKLLEDIRQFKSQSQEKHVILVTMHRRENFDNLKDMCLAIKEIVRKNNKNVLVILPVHPNPNVRSVVKEYLSDDSNIHIVEPISYDIFPHVLKESDIVMTDSGGIQEESASIGKPVILMRETTERPEGIYLGTIQQIGVKFDNIVNAVEKALDNLRKKTNSGFKLHLFGDGKASERIAKIFENFLFGRMSEDKNCSTKVRQDIIANEVYKTNFTQEYSGSSISVDEPKELKFEPYEKRKEKLVERTKAKDRLKMNQIFALPSKYNISMKNDDEFSVTAVVSLYRRANLTKRWVESLINQTHPPKIIWITYFASPVAKILDNEIEEIKLMLNKTGNPVTLLVNRGEMQLKYFGRFQLAIQTKTKYVVIFDDDSIPQVRFIEACLYTINTEDYNGMLGTKGTPFAENHFYGPVSGSETITEVDVIGGSWFMEREWVKLMFRDKMFSWATGEDWQICANARKYANVRSFVMPVNRDDPTTNGFTADYLAISYSGDTNGQVSGDRHNLRMNQNLRGDRYMHSYTRKEKTIIIFVESSKDAQFLLKIFHDSISMPIDVVIAVHNKNEAAIDMEQLKKIHSIKYFKDFMIGREYDSKITLVSQAAESMYHFDMVIQETQSTALIVMSSSANATTVAVATAAQLLKFPIINFHLEIETNNLEYSETIKNIATANILVNKDQTVDLDQLKKFSYTIQAIFI